MEIQVILQCRYNAQTSTEGPHRRCVIIQIRTRFISVSRLLTLNVVMYATATKSISVCHGCYGYCISLNAVPYWLTFLLRIREVAGSNLDSETDYPEVLLSNSKKHQDSTLNRKILSIQQQSFCTVKVGNFLKTTVFWDVKPCNLVCEQQEPWLDVREGRVRQRQG
jgi:hypothetical protein